MRERSELIFKVVCGLIAALVVYRLGLAMVHINPLYHVTIPALPALASATNAPGSTTNAAAKATKPSTNSLAQSGSGSGTNIAVQSTNTVTHATNAAEKAAGKLAEATNGPAHGTNELVVGTNAALRATNTLVQSSNGPAGQPKALTNGALAPQLAGVRPPPGMMPPGMPPGMMPGMMHGMPGMGAPGPPLPPEIQARLDKIIDSEILAPVMRPMPMALLGIAGKDVFLRAPNGQTGMIKEGEELGGVKVIRVGVNRVLVEEQGQRKELTIFSGLGSESLLSTQKDSTK